VAVPCANMWLRTIPKCSPVIDTSRSRSRGLLCRCSEPLSAPNAFHAVDVKQRHAPLNVIWEAAG
jgi:hypothetical protein